MLLDHQRYVGNGAAAAPKPFEYDGRHLRPEMIVAQEANPAVWPVRCRRLKRLRFRFPYVVKQRDGIEKRRPALAVAHLFAEIIVKLRSPGRARKYRVGRPEIWIQQPGGKIKRLELVFHDIVKMLTRLVHTAAHGQFRQQDFKQPKPVQFPHRIHRPVTADQFKELVPHALPCHVPDKARVARNHPGGAGLYPEVELRGEADRPEQTNRVRHQVSRSRLPDQPAAQVPGSPVGIDQGVFNRPVPAFQRHGHGIDSEVAASEVGLDIPPVPGEIQPPMCIGRRVR